jgi:PhnB protein
MPKKASNPIPEGMNTVTAYLVYTGDCAEALALYPKALGAKIIWPPDKTPDGKIMHAMIRIGDTNIMLSDTFAKKSAATGLRSNLWLYVDDCDALFKKAVKAGCTVTMPMEDAFWGDRLGQVMDPFGHTWNIASHKLDLTPEEMRKAEDEWMKAKGAVKK